tara:strand:- start:437 stop:988 length:552 start_codon:yes stop_codon:yes gene_type:complete
MKSLKNFDVEVYKKQKPPADNSLTTLKEVRDLTKLARNRDVVKKRDNIEKSFKEVADKHNLPFPKETVDKMIGDSAPKILQLKHHFKRPRPKHLAKGMGVNLKDIPMPSMKTPAYPSGHSVQGILIGKYLGDLYPAARKDFEKMGKDISYSRRIAGAHYKSDSDFGEKIGNDMYKYMKNAKTK